MPDVPEILTPGQKDFLRAMARTPLRDDFVFTGGTALSAIYLRHRFSEDLDFFTPNPEGVRPVLMILETVFKELKIQPRVSRQFATFCSFIADFENGESFKVDFAVDSPFRLKPPEELPEFGIRVDHVTDIAANKVSALFDRAEAKDFADVFFIVKEILPRDELIAFARKKHIGMDDYYLAQAFLRARDIVKLPRMIKPVTIAQLQATFEGWATDLAKKLGS